MNKVFVVENICNHKKNKAMWNLLIALVVSGDRENLEILNQELLDYRMPMTQNVNRANADDDYDFKDEILYQLDWKKIKRNIKLGGGTSYRSSDSGRLLRVTEEDSDIPITKYLFCADHKDFLRLQAALDIKYPSLDFDHVLLDEVFIEGE